jgi:hypothetical protein
MVAVGVATAISVTTVLETVAVVGAVMSVVGTITKNKTLSTVGMVLGAVGGIGALASSAIGGAAVLSDTAASGASDTLAVSDAGSAAASGGVESGTWDVAASAGGDAASSAAAPDVVGSLSNGLGSVTGTSADPGAALAGTPGAAPAGTEMAAQDTANLNDQLSLASTSTTPTTNVADAVAPGTTGAGSASPPVLPGQSGPGTGDLLNADTTPGTPLPPQAPANLGATDPTTGQVITKGLDASGNEISLPDSSSGVSGMLDKLVAYAGKNPVVAFGALQAGGSLLSGLTSTLTPAQVTALNAQAAANNAAAALTSQQTTNLAMPKAVASSAPVTGAPATLVPPTATPGFINQAPKQAPITGAPA